MASGTESLGCYMLLSSHLLGHCSPSKSMWEILVQNSPIVQVDMWKSPFVIFCNPFWPFGPSERPVCQRHVVQEQLRTRHVATRHRPRCDPKPNITQPSRHLQGPLGCKCPRRNSPFGCWAKQPISAIGCDLAEDAAIFLDPNLFAPTSWFLYTVTSGFVGHRSSRYLGNLCFGYSDHGSRLYKDGSWWWVCLQTFLMAFSAVLVYSTKVWTWRFYLRHLAWEMGRLAMLAAPRTECSVFLFALSTIGEASKNLKSSFHALKPPWHWGFMAHLVLKLDSQHSHRPGTQQTKMRRAL